MLELEQRLQQPHELHTNPMPEMVPPARAAACAPNLAYFALAAQGGSDNSRPAPQREPDAKEQAREALQRSMDTRQ